MPYFLSTNNLSVQQPVEFSADELRHLLLSHRIKVGEQVLVQGPDGKRFTCAVESVAKRQVVVIPKQQAAVPAEPKINIVLFQAMVAEKALDAILQKSTELGAAKIILFNSANTATKLTASVFLKKQERWGKILIEAAKQSERVVWPALAFAGELDDGMELAQKLDILYLTDISGQADFSLQGHPGSAGLIIGPEGGFTPEELQKFQAMPNVRTVSLGPVLLRADTAAVAALAIIRNNTL